MLLCIRSFLRHIGAGCNDDLLKIFLVGSDKTLQFVMNKTNATGAHANIVPAHDDGAIVRYDDFVHKTKISITHLMKMITQYVCI